MSLLERGAVPNLPVVDPVLVDLVLAGLALGLPAVVALVPSILVVVVPAPARVIYRIHHHRRALLAGGWAAAGILALRALLGLSPAAGVLAVELAAAGVTVLYLVLYPARIFAPVTDPQPWSAAELGRPGTGPDDREEVVGLVVEGRPRAYTLTTLIRSHLVIDPLAGGPLAVTYCSLSATGAAFRVPGSRLRAVTAVDNNVVLYDEASGDLVHQATGRVVCGPGLGGELESLPVTVTTWGRWRRLHPDTLVVHQPPVGRFDRVLRTLMLRLHRSIPGRSRPFHPLSYHPDPRLPAMTRVLGVRGGGTTRAYPPAALPRSGVRCDELGGEPVAVLAEGGGGDALAGAYSRRLGGRVLDLEPVTEDIGAGAEPATGNLGAVVARDAQTGSLWDVAGRAVAGPLAGSRLEPLPGHQAAFWFIWAAVHPDTEVAEAGDPPTL